MSKRRINQFTDSLELEFDGDPVRLNVTFQRAEVGANAHAKGRLVFDIACEQSAGSPAAADAADLASCLVSCLPYTVKRVNELRAVTSPPAPKATARKRAKK